MGKQLQPLS